MELEKKQIQKLVQEAIKARKYSYSPYSHFAVGAALLTKSGRIYTGCNIENAGYSSTVCAERTALFKAVSEGELEFTAIAVAGGPAGAEPLGGKSSVPCGVCRQVLLEFCEELMVIGAGSEEDYCVYRLSELVPHPFGPKSLAE